MWDQKTGINVSAIEGSERISGSGSNNQPIDDKKIFESFGEDSGFLSGPQNLYSSESIDTHSDVGPDITPKYRDSGAIDGNEDDDDDKDNTKDTKSSSMILDSGVDVGLSEWFCELNLKNSTLPLNNLGSCRKTVDEPKYSKISKLLENRPLWEICYVQDADGDT